ncbi:hypothetical protein NOM68_18535, partial [Proteus mirabilis]|nr:hypothetical protein [Proteus mirabilis]
ILAASPNTPFASNDITQENVPEKNGKKSDIGETLNDIGDKVVEGANTVGDGIKKGVETVGDMWDSLWNKVRR